MLAYDEGTISVIAFTAQLCAARLANHRDFLSAAELDFHCVFEETPASPADLKAADIQKLNVNVPIVAQWIKHAGRVIYNCEDSFDLPERDGLWRGQPGFSWGRWKLWKERAEWVADLKKHVRAETRDAAREMVATMVDIEKGT